VENKIEHFVSKIIDENTNEEIADLMLYELAEIFTYENLSDYIYWNDDEPTMVEIVETLLMNANAGGRDSIEIESGLDRVASKVELIKIMHEKNVDYWRRHDEVEGIPTEHIKQVERDLGIDIPSELEWLIHQFGVIQSDKFISYGVYRGEDMEWNMSILTVNQDARAKGLPEHYVVFGKGLDGSLVMNNDNDVFCLKDGVLEEKNKKMIEYLIEYI
jgi:hypothetical protein